VAAQQVSCAPHCGVEPAPTLVTRDVGPEGVDQPVSVARPTGLDAEKREERLKRDRYRRGWDARSADDRSAQELEV
jgi:hypothetical protein